MDIKVEIKKEPCFQDFYSESGRDSRELIKKVKIETSDSDIKPVLESSKCITLNEEEHLMKFNETIKESEIEPKIDIKEEYWWLKREDSCVHNDIKDETQEDICATKNPSLHKEAASTYTSDFSSTENLENDEGLNMNVANAECGSDRKCQGQESVVADICSIETGFRSETSDDRKTVNIASCLKQSKLLQQCNKTTQDINKKNCKSILSNECSKSYKCDVSKSVEYSSNLKQCTLAFDRKKVDKCDVSKKDLYLLSLKTQKDNICDKSLTCLQRLKTREVNHEGVKPHKCNICNKGFTRLSHLKEHKVVHDGIKPHKCNICNKTFTQASSLKTHTLSHEGIKPYKCNICNKGFTQSSDLKRHALIHEGIKPHKCNICNKAFTQSSSLKTHTLSHEGIKPHTCNICNKGFTQSSHLKEHKLIHEGIKLQKCNICNKTFTQLYDLKRHSLIHEGIKPHKCNICDKAFTQLYDLKRHSLSHKGIKPHKCNICDKAFTRLSDLKRHSLIHKDIKRHK